MSARHDAGPPHPGREGGGVGPVIGVLVCDHVVDPPLLAASGGADYGDMYTTMLRRAEPSISTVVHDVVGGDLPDDPAACDAWIITGSRHDAHGDEPWLRDLRAFVADLHAAGSRTVGVCFGHQVVAHALGGRSGPAGEWRAGPNHLKADATPWFDQDGVWLNAMHRDVVHELPPGAEPIGTGTTARYPLYLVGDHILCVQDHPEFDAAYTSALIEARRSRLGDDLADDALHRVATVPTDGGSVGRWLTDFLLDRRR